jgi:hypothetical protein
MRRPTATAAEMRRLQTIAVLALMWASPALAADKLAPLDAEFLEYLASFGGDEEDWALFADEEPAPDESTKAPPAKRVESKEAAARPAEKR